MNKCFNCKEEVEPEFTVHLVMKGTFSPILLTNKDGTNATTDRDYENDFCPHCAVMIARFFSDNVRPENQRGKTYDIQIQMGN